uniref:G-protein coupled receptors family 1 profile domain-containing protein n=1 Tax=Sphenodon punctatus TaxID=8508 RepID=A0A8D0G9H1_SPHPU
MISHNMSWIKYPSQSLDTHISIEEIIASQNIISRFMHCYIALFVPTGLIASIFILIIFIKNYLRHNALENLDLFLFAYAICNMITILLSVTVITRPAYLKVTHLGCGTLSFFFNVSYFMSQYLLVLMMITFLLARYPSRAALITSATGRPMLCVGFVLTCAFCISLVVVALLGTDNYHIETDCQLDPLFAWPEYEIVKFTFGFGLPSLFQILCFIPFFVKEAQPDVPSLRQNIHVYLAVLTIMASTFACCLFYNIMILSRTTLKLQRSIGTPKNELMMNIAEIVLFSESCVSSIFVLCLHKQYRHGIWTIIKNLTKICRRKETTSNPPEIPETEIVVTSLHSRNRSH